MWVRPVRLQSQSTSCLFAKLLDACVALCCKRLWFYLFVWFFLVVQKYVWRISWAFTSCEFGWLWDIWGWGEGFLQESTEPDFGRHRLWPRAKVREAHVDSFVHARELFLDFSSFFWGGSKFVFVTSGVITLTQKGDEFAAANFGSFSEGEDDGACLEEVPFKGFDSEEQQLKLTACSTNEATPAPPPFKPKKMSVPPVASFKDLKEKRDILKADSSETAKKSLHFGEPTSESQLEELCVKQFAETMDKKIAWSVNMFKEWHMNRLRVSPYNNTHGTLQWVNLNDTGNLLKPHLSLALCCFLNEIKRKDGKDFPGKSLYEILMCLQFHLEKRGLFWKLLDDSDFVKVKFTLDNIMKKRAQSQCTPDVWCSTPISYSDEEKMWSSGILGELPDQLSNTIMFLLGMHLALRGGEEHRQLRCPPFNCQLTISRDSANEKVLLYQEDFKTKTNQGGLSGRKFVPKQVKIYPNTANSDRDPVRLFKKYVGLLPSDGKYSAFYKYGLKLTRLSPVQWYADKPLSVNALKKIVKELTSQAGLVGNFTNHSLRSTAATRMYSKGIDEQVIKEVTGHRSDAVRAYKRTSDNLLKEASSVIGSDKPKEFDINDVQIVKSPPVDRSVSEESIRMLAHKKNCKKCANNEGSSMCLFLKALDRKVESDKKRHWLSMKWVHLTCLTC